MDVSVVIVNWNAKAVLVNCLGSIYAETRSVSFEVIVIDNASSDGSAGMVKKDFPDVVLIENHRNVGFASANNQGMAIARGRAVLILNPDTVILKDAIARAVRFLDEHPQAAVVGCRVLSSDGTLQQTCAMEPTWVDALLSATYLYKMFPRHRFFARERLGWWDHDEAREVDIVAGCFMLVRNAAIQAVGPMDGALFLYSEEWDWCYRFRKAGWQVFFTPDAEIVHLGRQSTRVIGPLTHILQVESKLYYQKKKKEGLWPRLAYRFFTGLFYALRSPFWMFKTILPGQGRDDAASTLKAYATVVMLAWFNRQETVLQVKKEIAKYSNEALV